MRLFLDYTYCIYTTDSVTKRNRDNCQPCTTCSKHWAIINMKL
jgi:hypothetical protein